MKVSSFAEDDAEICLHTPKTRSSVQVDEALEVLAMICHLPTAALISQHHTALLTVLEPAPDDAHTLVNLAAYCHLLLPWEMLPVACAEATTGRCKMLQECGLGDSAFQASRHSQHTVLQTLSALHHTTINS